MKKRKIYFSDFQNMLLEADWLQHGQCRAAVRIFQFDRGNFYPDKDTGLSKAFSEISISQKWLGKKLHMRPSNICKTLDALYPYVERLNPRHTKDVTRLRIWWEGIREDTAEYVPTGNTLCSLRKQAREISIPEGRQSKDISSLPYVAKVENKSKDVPSFSGAENTGTIVFDLEEGRHAIP